jgi:hypothetical protein
MIEKTHGYDVIVDFWEWYQRRNDPKYDPLASLALDKCEESVMNREWDSFGYWHAIYLRQRSKGSVRRTGQ